MSLTSLEGCEYGPVDLPVESGGIADLIVATGDEPGRWSGYAPPYLASVALFTVAPRLLADPVVVPFTRSLIHAEQSFKWYRALEVGDEVSVTGRVGTVRARGPVHLVAFDLEARGGGGPWLEARSVFLLSDEAAVAAEEKAEPEALERGDNDKAAPLELPAAGEPVEAMARSASRADLVRYAGATRDWNPIHWDHDSARRAGLPGIVVHGLLMVAWLIQAGARYHDGPAPLVQMRARFRRPLHPGDQAVVGGKVQSVGGDHAALDLSVASDGEALLSSSVWVTR